MICGAVQSYLSRPVEGKSGAIPFCTTTSTGLFVGDNMKTCTKCNQIKPLSDFPPNKNMKKGVGSWCRDCINHYWHEHKSQVRQRNIKFRKSLDWVDVQMTLIELSQAEFMQVFMPYLYDHSKRQTYFEKIREKGFQKLLPANEL